MYRGVIFDLDGTLINSLPDIAGAMNRSLSAVGLPGFPVEDYRLKVGNGVFKIAERAVGDRTDLTEKVLSLYMPDYAQNCCRDSFVYDGIAETLQALADQGIKVSVLSNKDQHDVESVMAHYLPQIPFSRIVGRREGLPLKPAPDGALWIARELNIPAEDFLYVGDTMMDMECGRAAGMTTVGVTWGFREREELAAHQAKYIIDRPEELIAILRSCAKADEEQKGMQST